MPSLTRAVLLTALTLAGCAAAPAPTDDTDTAVCGGVEDCPTSTTCLAWSCEDQACVSTPQNLDVALPEQVEGDCRMLVCGTNGTPFPKPDATDAPVSTPCTTWTCEDGAAVRVDADLGGTCDGGVCDGEGACVTCLTVAQRDACSGGCDGVKLCVGETCEGNEDCASGSCPDGTCG